MSLGWSRIGDDHDQHQEASDLDEDDLDEDDLDEDEDEETEHNRRRALDLGDEYEADRRRTYREAFDQDPPEYRYEAQTEDDDPDPQQDDATEDVDLDTEDGGPGDWCPFDSDKKAPPPFPDRFPPASRKDRQHYPDLSECTEDLAGQLYGVQPIPVAFAREFADLLEAFANVRPTAGSIYRVIQTWRRYSYEVMRWAQQPVDKPVGPLGCNGCSDLSWANESQVSWTLMHLRALWCTPEAEYYTEVRDAFRQGDEMSIERLRTRAKKSYKKRFVDAKDAKQKRKEKSEREKARYQQMISSDPEARKKLAAKKREQRAKAKAKKGILDRV